VDLVLKIMLQIRIIFVSFAIRLVNRDNAGLEKMLQVVKIAQQIIFLILLIIVSMLQIALLAMVRIIFY